MAKQNLKTAFANRVNAACSFLKSKHPNAPHKFCNDLLAKLFSAEELKMSDLFGSRANAGFFAPAHRIVHTKNRTALIEVLETVLEKLPPHVHVPVVNLTKKEIKMNADNRSGASSYVSTLVSLRKAAKELKGRKLDEEMSARLEQFLSDGVETRIAAFAEFSATA